MTTEDEREDIKEGERDYREWRESLFATPEKRALYEEVAAKSELWLQLVEARIAAGLTPEEMARRLGTSPAQVSRMEKRGYDAYSLHTLRRYVRALGENFEIEVRVLQRDPARSA